MPPFDALVTVGRRRFHNPDNGWAVLEAALDDGTALVLVGPLVHLEADERAHVTGEWVRSERYGEQVKVAEARPLEPAAPGAVAGYLRRIRHVGARRADALIGAFGAARVIEAIDADPPAAFARAGLSPSAVGEAAASWDELRGLRRLHMLLAPHGLAHLVTRLHAALGDGAARAVAERPYELTSLYGVGFAIADRIARAAGTPADGPARGRAAILHALAEVERDGSTCAPVPAVLAAARELLGGGETDAADESAAGELAAAVDALLAEGDAVRDGDWLYRRETAELEAELAGLIGDLLGDRARGRLPEAPESPPPEELTDEQRGAVTAAFAHRLSLVTGGPGTGKTATIRAIGTAALASRAKLMLVAPTGRAAIRMTEATGFAARTVHSALGWVPGEGPVHDADTPLACDLLIADECSMANLEVLVTLLRAVGERTHVVLVGDADQLAPVGAGKPFAELIASERVPTTRLTHIFRQAAGSMIVQGAHAVRQGRTPSFAAGEGMRRDLFLIRRGEPAAALAEIVSLVAERLPAHYSVDPVRDVQVFAPVYRGEVGIDRLNEALRAALNPDGEPVRGGRLRRGDKVMLTGRNLHELGLMNGMLLTLLDEVAAADAGDSDALLLAADDAVFRLPVAEAERLRLAYACSVHRGQGIELPVAVIVAHPAAGAYFLRREMLYTAMTRARLATVIVGTEEVIARAVRTADTVRRHTRLAERLAAAEPVSSGGSACGPSG